MRPARRLALLALASLLSAWTAAAPADQRPAKNSGEIRNDLNSEMAELTARLQKLAEFQRGYKKGDPVERIEGRVLLREDVVRRAAALSTGLQYFRQIRGLEEARLFDSTDFEKEVVSSVKTADEMLADESKAFKSARLSYRIKTILWRVA
ncbi:MAG: hypothetical protein WCI75_17665, partial [candidate division NC10 bacterium]